LIQPRAFKIKTQALVVQVICVLYNILVILQEINNPFAEENYYEKLDNIKNKNILGII
jgi:hypothetical protein